MRILRIHEVCRLTGISRTTIWRREQEGLFPPRVRISRNAVGWLDAEVLEFIEARAASRWNDDERTAAASGMACAPEVPHGRETC